MAKQISEKTKLEQSSSNLPTESSIGNFDLDKKVTIRNLADWEVSFQRIDTNNYGDVLIPPNSVARLSRSEIVAQVNNGNKLFNGLDSIGSHATIYIEDIDTRKYLGFETDNEPQYIITINKIADILNLDYNQFVEEIRNKIKLRFEKRLLIKYLKELDINDYAKIRFCEDYCGMKMM